jgi:hypothetical protein
MEGKIRELVAKMYTKKPANSTLGAGVCVTVLQKKYASEFPPDVDWAETVRPIVIAALAELDAAAKPKPVAPVATAVPPPAAKNVDASSDDDDDEEDDSDDSSSGVAEGSYDSEEDPDAEEADGDEEGEEEPDDEDASDTGSDEEEGEAAAKRHRVEATTDERDKRTLEMIAFAKKAGLNARPAQPDESLATYREYLDGIFKQNALDPATCDLGKEGLRGFKMRQELKHLQSEIDVNLDRRARRGRAQFYVPGESEGPAPVAKPKFTPDTGLFDDDE